MNSTVWLTVATFLGWGGHFIADLMEDSISREIRITPLEYIKQRPYKTLLSVLGTMAGLMILYPDLVKQMEADLVQLSTVTAIGLGYGGDSLFSKAATFSSKALDKIGTPP